MTRAEAFNQWMHLYAFVSTVVVAIAVAVIVIVAIGPMWTIAGFLGVIAAALLLRGTK